MRNGTLFEAVEIRDTDEHFSSNGNPPYVGMGSGEGAHPGGPFAAIGALRQDPVDYIQVSPETKVIFAAKNSLDKDVDLQYQGSYEGQDWFDIGSPITLAANDGINLEVLTDPWPKVRLSAIAVDTPTTGSLTVGWASKRRGGI